MFSILYRIAVSPIELLLESLLHIVWESHDRNVILAIVILSLVVNVITFPLYRWAEDIQKNVRVKQQSILKWKKRIQKSFSGDERLLVLAAYYRENNYSSFDSMKGTLPLLLQVPFFLAAYQLLISSPLLEDHSFLYIADLRQADVFMCIGGIEIHLLPILMTIINLLATCVYSSTLPLTDKLQGFLLAVFFLVLLYDSPAGLVIYWLGNNVFSLFKNIALKYLHDTDILFDVLCAVVGVIMWNGFIGWAFFLPLLWRVFGKRIRNFYKNRIRISTKKIDRVFRAEMICVILFVGLWIPVSTIASSPEEFVNIYHYINPLHYVGSTLSILLGCGAWLTLIYHLCKKTGKLMITYLLGFMILYGCITLAVPMFRHGVMSNEMVYVSGYVNTDRQFIYGIEIAIALLLILYYICEHSYEQCLMYIAAVTSVVFCVLAARGIWQIRQKLLNLKIVDVYRQEDGDEQAGVDHPIFRLSKNGKNVIVIMLDREAGAYFPYMIAEKPELQEIYAGFTYFPNTVSPGEHTNFGAFPLYGGYEYTPRAMEERETERIEDKINEALSVMPVLFSMRGYDVMVSDPPYAGFQETPDISIYDEYPDISANVLIGKYNVFNGLTMERHISKCEHNMVCYSLMQVLPPIIQEGIYENGGYHIVRNDGVWFGTEFTYSYSELSVLPELTQIQEDDQNCFMLFQNPLPHYPITLQLPDYIPVFNPDNRLYTELESYRLGSEYQVNMASILLLGKWLEFLKEEGVYDCCRIIIASDHGPELSDFPELQMNEELNVERVNSILLYKDFHETEFRISDEFMCNADVPWLAAHGLISPLENPFTGREISTTYKEQGIDVTLSDNWNLMGLKRGNYAFDTSDSPWYRVYGNIFDPASWQKIREAGEK